KLRMERQETVLGRDVPIRLMAIVSEAALARIVGSPKVMAGQIAHLRKLAAHENVDIRVLTFEGGAHAAMLGDFAVLDFDNDDDPSVAYLETQVGARYLEHPAQLNEYRRV